MCQTADDSRGPATAPESAPRAGAEAPRPPRPIALQVLPENIPAEIKASRAWVCWRYEWNEKRQKWDKIPYTPYTTKKAASTRPSTWCTFDEAYACYQERRDYFDGVFFTLQESDSYVGGDFDHNTDPARVPPTYAERSPGNDGQRFIGIGTIPGPCKKPAGELYSRARFLSITGHKLPSAPADIRPIQEALDTLYAQLKGTSASAVRDGKAGSGNRAELTAAHTEAEWDEGRRLLRTSIEFQVRCLNKSAKEGTQLAYLLAGDYAGFHAKWPHAGLYRADGSLDDSQVRAIMACSIYGRGFSFPRYCALMSHFFAAQALAKWGTKQAWREEMAALWHYATERTGYAPRPIAPKRALKRALGRANVHATTVEQVYGLLLEHKAGTDAIIHIGDVAAALGVHRRTVTSILDELRLDKRITTRRLSGGGGLLVTFEPQRDVIIPVVAEAELSAPEQVNAVSPTTIEETRVQDVSLLDRAKADHISEPPTLLELAREYLSDPTIGRRVNVETGQITNRRTAKHFADLVCADYSAYTADDARAAYKAEQQRLAELERQGWQRFFVHLRNMTDADLIAYIAGRARASLLGVVDHTEEQAPTINTFDKHLYATRLKCAKQHLAWRGLKMPAKPTKEKPITPHTRQQRKAGQRQGAAQPDLFISSPVPIYDAVGLIGRLRARQEAAYG